MKKNKFNMDFENLLSCNMSEIIPIVCQEILPGDNIQYDAEIFGRTAPMIAPLLGRVNVRVEKWFVPLRIIWDDYEEFFTRGRNMDSTIEVPKIVIDSQVHNLAGMYEGSLADRFGINPLKPTDVLNSNHYLNALPFRAYHEIWNYGYRNQEVQDEWKYNKGSANVMYGDHDYGLLFGKLSNWDTDYFTSAKKQALLSPDLFSFALVEDSEGSNSLYKLASTVKRSDSGPISSATYMSIHADAAGDDNSLYATSLSGEPLVRIENLSKLGVSVDELRRAGAMQRWVELLIRVGYRYQDYLRGFWNQDSSNKLLDYPQFLGSDKIPVRINDIPNMTDTSDNDTPLGTLAGQGTMSGGIRRINTTFEEHGYFFVMLRIIPKTCYFQGMPPTFLKFDHLDYANPMLANLGMQELPTSELYYDWQDTPENNAVNFGYKPRYAEYKSNVSRVSGEFRSSLDYWHMGREFATRPTLSDSFITCYPKLSVFPVESGDKFYLNIFNNMSMLRNLPYYSNPVID